MTRFTTSSIPSRLGSIIKQAWRDLLSIYYANAPVWRILKTGALLFFGFFLWMGGNVLHAYWPDVTVLQYVIAYGFVLLFWGPLTHLIVVPVVVRLRRTTQHPTVRSIVNHASKLNFTLFLLVVLVFGATMPGVMVLDFTSGLGEEGTTVDAEVTCDIGEETVSCHLEKNEGVDHVVLLSGGEELDRADEPPYRVEASRDELAVGRTDKQFVVELRDEDGEALRRIVKTVEE